MQIGIPKEIHEGECRVATTPEVAKELSGVRRLRILPALPAGEAWLFRYERESDVLPRGGPRVSCGVPDAASGH